MITYRHEVAGDTVEVRVPQSRDDLREFHEWVKRADARGPIALDTETTGLDIFGRDYRLRTVQFGDAHTAWVLHFERGGSFVDSARWALRVISRFRIHNAPFDWLVLDIHAATSLESLAPRTVDTKILATLVDPRQPQEGGIGTGLKSVSARYVDPTAPDTQGDLTAVFRSLGLTKATGFARIDLDHPTYNLYAGLDVILTSRVAPILADELERLGVRDALIAYEHEIARLCAHMQRRGMLLDEDYARELSRLLLQEEEEFKGVAARYGVEKINSPTQVAEALLAMGETLTERTESGELRVDKSVLSALADLSLQGDRLDVRNPNPLAEAVIKSKRAGKWRASYADTFLEQMDSEGRVHPTINSIQARTGRMSVTGPALQTLPSSDQKIRRALLAEPGHVMVSTDFAAVEMRVLAALADVKQMKHAIQTKQDLHNFTAELVYGPNYTKQHRKICKGVGFGTVYGGGPETISRQTGAGFAEVRTAQQKYHRVYPEIRRAGNRWQREAFANSMVAVSVTGRRLPLDRDRTYAVTNYQVQSAARDCLGQAMLNMEQAGLLELLRLPIHDEVLCSAPEKEATDVAREVERCMTFDLFGVPIEAEAEIGKRSWGSLYGADY